MKWTADSQHVVSGCGICKLVKVDLCRIEEMSIHTYIHTYIHTHIHTYTYIHTHIYIHVIHYIHSPEVTKLSLEHSTTCDSRTFLKWMLIILNLYAIEFSKLTLSHGFALLWFRVVYCYILFSHTIPSCLSCHT